MKFYNIYDNRSGEMIISCGRAKECAEAMGVSMSSFYTTITRVQAGRNKRWTIEEVSQRQNEDEVAMKDYELSELEKEIERKYMAEWEKLIPKAKAVCLVILHSIYPNLVCNLRYEHVDAAGWWFTYELLNDRRRQTYCVGHMEV